MQLKFFTDDEKFPYFIQYGEHKDNMYMHTHADFCELVIVLRGSATHIVGTEHFNVQKGDVFIISDNTEHGYENTDDFCICNIMFRTESFIQHDYDIKKSAGFHALFVLESYFSKEHNFTSRFKLKLSDFQKVRKLTDMMLHEYQTKAEGWQTLFLSGFTALTVNLSRLYGNYQTEKKEIMNLASAVSYIENHFNEKITIEMLARVAHYSARHFSRIFKETYGQTPIEYVISLRIEYACKMLKNSTSSLSEIALKSGFGDSNYFCRIFKKHTGITPNKFRK